MNAREKPQLDGLPTLQDGQCKSTVLSSQAEVSVDLRQPRASTRGHDQRTARETEHSADELHPDKDLFAHSG